MMIFRHILASAYIGFFIFILLTLIFGNGGLLDSRNLSVFKSRLESNIGELKEINENLTLELKALSTSPDTLKVYAREYGYFEKEEKVLKIEGAPTPAHYYKLGSLLKRNAKEEAFNPVFHVIGIAAALLSFFVSVFLASKKRSKTRYEYFEN